MLQSMRSAAKYIWIILIVAFVGSFLLYETSGLAGRAPVTTTTSIGSVNGEEILLTVWQNAVTQLETQQQQQLGRGLSLDERKTLEDRAFNELVNEILLQQEYKRRGITVTDDEILQAARNAPPPQAQQSPDLQTNGQFDFEKYQRLLASPMARQSGMLAGLEAYYRSEIPKQKLFDQVASGAYLSDERLWQVYRDRHDSVTVSFVTLRPELLTDTSVTVTDAELSQFYEKNKKRFERSGRAVVSLLTVPRTVTSFDSADARMRAERVRAEVVGGAKFDEVAKRESADSGSAVLGGALGKKGKGSYVAKFEEAAYTLKVGEISQPVLTQFGYHIIKMNGRSGDTLDLSHILINVAQSDSSATRTDRRADSLASKAASQEDGKAFDEAAKTLGLTPVSVVANENEPLSFAGRYVPSVSAWAFSGVRPGETSDLFDSPEAYYVARIDSLTPGGQQPLSEVKTEIRRRLSRDKRLEKLRPIGEQLVAAATSGTLEAAAAAKNLPVEKSAPFSRVEAVPGLGQYSPAIGAAFAAAVGAVSGPFKALDAMVVMRVESRTEAQRSAFEAEKATQRTQMMQGLRQQRVEEFLNNLRESVKVDDNRATVLSQLRRQSGV